MSVYDYMLDDSAAAEESELNWQTREMLERICASVSNVIDDFTADVSMMGDDFNA